MGTPAVLFNRRRRRQPAPFATVFTRPTTSERQLAAEIRAQGNAADIAAASLRAYMPNPFPPQRPKHPVKDWA